MMSYGEYKNATTAWETLYNQLKSEEYAVNLDVRGNRMAGEMLNNITVIENPLKGLVNSSIRNLSVPYAVGELLWYLSGSNMVKDISRYGKAWNDLTDDNLTVNSAYGYRIKKKFGFDQWEFVKDILKRDPNSRQATIHIKDASNVLTKDTPCTIALQYQIRDNKLYATTVMRSNDIWLGWPYDVFAFTSFQILMAMELGVELGTYTHIALNLHLYEKDVK